MASPPQTISPLITFTTIAITTLFFLSTPSLSSSSSPFSPADNYLIDCGSPQQTRLADGRTFKSERDTASLLSTAEDLRLSAASDSVPAATSSVPPTSLPLLATLRLFSGESIYSFHISQPGRHFLRLYFYPIPNPTHHLNDAVFRVSADGFVLLEDFSVSKYNASVIIFKEFLINVETARFSLVFSPRKNSVAFVNAIEVVSAPDSLIPGSAESVFPPESAFDGLARRALEVNYRLNIGGPGLSPLNDSLYRNWESDEGYNVFVEGSRPVSVGSKAVGFPGNGQTSPIIAPRLVYSSAQHMQDPKILEPNFNLTWNFTVEMGYSYLVRLHFCDIVSLALNSLYFDVYINGMSAVSSLDLSSLAGELSTAYHRDFVVDSGNVTESKIMVQVGCSDARSGVRDAILNGLEIMKLSNSADSLGGNYTVDGKYRGPNSGPTAMKIVAALGLGLAVTATLLLGSVFLRWRRRPKGWEKQKSNISSWLLPLQLGMSSTSFWSSSRSNSLFGSRRSKSGYSSFFAAAASSVCFGRVFTLSELRAATQSFDEKAVIGVGGFGKVYLGELEDGTKLAIKRGNASSEQGINEFRTEIEMLSKLRHRHLVSLIGFCDEQSEMILVYEYMANGPLRDHLYGPAAAAGPTMTWKQRLEICIGAARGLHYLHTGAAQGIIHRDVKTTNILLDDSFVAKVSDFGLSKAAPDLDKTHVSTAVKGSFGYLDPEYFRRQQLTEKSDVYSFGVVLFEALCGRSVIDPKLPREQVSLAEWAMHWHRKGLVEKIVDARIAGTIGEESLKKFVEAAEKCLAEDGADRPSMGDVLWNLEYSLQLQEAASVIVGDKSECLISVPNLPSEFGSREEARKGKGKGNEVQDDSSVTIDGDSLFSQIGHIQGR